MGKKHKQFIILVFGKGKVGKCVCLMKIVFSVAVNLKV